MKTIIFTNQKGGVGKTTLTRELGVACAKCGYSVLLVDSDPQGNLTESLTTPSREAGLYEALEEGTYDLIGIRENLELLAGNRLLASLEKRYLGEIDAYGKFSTLFAQERISRHDLVLIDSPPSLGVMTLNGLAASDHFVIPLRPGLYSLQGTNDLLSSVSKVKKNLNPSLDLLGVVMNDYLSGPVISRQIHEEVKEAFGKRVFETVISRTVKVEEAIASREGVIEGMSKIARQVSLLATEFLFRLGLEEIKGG
jgi:chromosome partitioning protein